MGGQAKAPSPQANPANGVNQFNVGNVRPVGQSTGFQQPSSYEEGIKLMDENLKAYGTKHKINTLRGAISRWAPPSDKNDTEGYINFVAQRTGLKPDQEIDLSNPAVRHVITGPMMLMEKGNKGIFGTKQTTTQESSDPFSSFLMGGKVEEIAPSAEKPSTKGLKPKLFGQAEGAVESEPYFEKFKKTTEKAKERAKTELAPLASLADIATGVVPGTVGQVAYPVARAFGQSPEEATKTTQSLVEPLSQPFGKALGVTETEGYQKEATRRAVDAIGQYVGESADTISQKTGLPKEDVESMINTLTTAFGAKVGQLKGKLPELKAKFEQAFPKMEEPKPVAPAEIGRAHV